MCDCLVALPSATGGPFTLFAKNSDRPPNEPQDVEWSPARRDIGSVRATHIAIDPWHADTLGCLLSRPRWCWGAEHGVNVAGVAIGNEAIYTTLDPRTSPPALIGMDLVRLGLERGSTAAGATQVITDFLGRYGQGGTCHDVSRVGRERPYWSSFLVADPTEAWVIETSGATWMTDRVDQHDAAVRAISNRTTIPEFDRMHRHPGQAVERLVDPRWRASQHVLEERPVLRDRVAAHLRSHDSCGEPGWSVCMHVPGIEATTASMIAELHGDGEPHRAWVLLGHPCEEEYRPLIIGEPFAPIRSAAHQS